MRRKQLYAIVLAGALTVSMAPTSVFAAEEAAMQTIDAQAESTGRRDCARRLPRKQKIQQQPKRLPHLPEHRNPSQLRRHLRSQSQTPEGTPSAAPSETPAETPSPAPEETAEPQAEEEPAPSEEETENKRLLLNRRRDRHPSR